MRKLQIIILIILGSYLVTTGQNVPKIDDKLQQEITQHKKSEKLRINIILNEQYNQAEMRTKMQHIRSEEEKRSFAVNELKHFSQETQKNLIRYLSDMRAKTTVSDIQSLWIANTITCYASIEIIEELSKHPDVLIIGLDNEQRMIPESSKPTQEIDSNVVTKVQAVDPNREITYNITKVRANEVWAQGYTGQNVVVAILDTGVNYNHSDLSGNMWTHPDYPYHGWNFVSNNNNPMDDHSHGTHCAGTVAGQGASGTYTGIAPNAKIMAIKVWNSSAYGSIFQMCDGIQFATDNGAHVISMSGGIQGGGNMYERIMFRNTMINVLNMGIVATIAAGNEGTKVYPPNSVRTPGNCPPPWLHPDQTDQTEQGGLTAVISVGATDQNDNIWEDSSRGPIMWQDIAGFNDYSGAGLIRPDVVAPGVDIKSLARTGGYVEDSGTSMATPCVAGVIALMLSKHPNLTPAKICEILETTAQPLSATKSNIYGSGRIDAYKAVQAVQAACITITNFTNQTVTANRTIADCVINVQNVTVQNNAKLTLDAVNVTTINGPFEVKLGSQLEVK